MRSVISPATPVSTTPGPPTSTPKPSPGNATTSTPSASWPAPGSTSSGAAGRTTPSTTRPTTAPCKGSSIKINNRWQLDTGQLIGVLGIAAIATSLFLFLLPAAAIAIWPWTLTELTARVMGAIFALGIAGLGAFVDKRSSSMRILVQVAGFMLGLILVAAARAHGDFDVTKPLTWLFAAGFLGMAGGSAILYSRMELAGVRNAGYTGPGE